MNSPRTVEDPTRRYYVRTPDGMVGPYTQRGAETVKNRRNLGAGPLSRCEVVRQDVPVGSTKPLQPVSNTQASAGVKSDSSNGRSRRRGQAAPTNGSVCLLIRGAPRPPPAPTTPGVRSRALSGTDLSAVTATP